MDKTRIAVLVSGGGTNLQALIDAQNAGILTSGKIEVVISSSKEAYALQRAKRAGIPGETVCKKECAGQADFESRIKRILRDYEIDLIVLAGFLCILSAEFTGDYPERILNIHPSLIPAFCGEGYYGLRVHEEALKYGVKVTGATVHYVNEIPDGGKILLQKAVAVREDDTPHSLQKRVMRLAEWKILPKAAEMVSRKILEERKDG